MLIAPSTERALTSAASATPTAIAPIAAAALSAVNSAVADSRATPTHRRFTTATAVETTTSQTLSRESARATPDVQSAVTSVTGTGSRSALPLHARSVGTAARPKQ